ncbi:AAA family ATPase [Herbiconiux daphne]|uniref:AAA family ATPase n=1 Tax=Herbiconiux daphne TaxID=2970914 RepID=UPI0038B25EF3
MLVGDPYQLPPIGDGTPFIDFIKSRTYPHTHLQSIHRQSVDNDLVEFSNLVKDNISLPSDKI